MVYQSSSLKRPSWQDQSTPRVAETSSSYWKWCVTAYLTKLVPPMSLQILDFPHQTLHTQRANLSRRSDNSASKSQQWLRVSKYHLLSRFPWNEHILTVRLVVNAKTATVLRYAKPEKTLKHVLISGQRHVFQPMEASGDPCTCRFALWICTPAHTAVHNLLKEHVKSQGSWDGKIFFLKSWTWAQRPGMAQWSWRSPPSDSGRWWVSPRCCL